MLERSMRSVLVVILVALILGPASILLVAADEHGAGSMIKLEPGGDHWYTLAYPGSGTVDISMDVDPVGGATFMIVTADAVRAWEAGEELVATGQGAENPYEDADLFWSGDLGPAGDYYLVVEYTGDGTAPSNYSLDVSGAAVSSEAAAEEGLPAGADGIWCYTPTGMPVLVELDFVPPGKYLSAGNYVGEWTGTFHGVGSPVAISQETGMAVVDEKDPANPFDDIPMTYIGAISLAEVEVGGLSGGLEMNTIGELPDPSGGWKGTWVITSATDDLEGLQGHGTWWGPGFNPEEPEECGVIYYSVDSMSGP